MVHLHGTAGSDVCELDRDSDFEDALSETGDTTSEGGFSPPARPRWPRDTPNGEQVLREVATIRASMQPDGKRALALTPAVSRCRDHMAKEAPPLFAFTRVLGEDQRRAVWALYGVCQEFANAKMLEDLNDSRSRLRRAFNADLAVWEDDDVWAALRATLGRYAVPKCAFEEYAEGIAKRPSVGCAFKTVDEMLKYAYRTAGVVGLITLPVLAEDAFLEAEVVEASVALGLALQLTDMLNCVGHHFRQFGICWIPEECLQQHSIDYSELESNLRQESTTLVKDPRWQALMRELLGLVPPLLGVAAQGGERLPGGGRMAVRAAVRMCRRMIRCIEARSYNSLGSHEEMFSWRIIGDMAGAVMGPEHTPARPAVLSGDVGL